MATRKAKYRVKNAQGEYDVIYLETSADQVKTSQEQQFISQTEKTAYADKFTKAEVNAMFQEANAEAEGLASQIAQVSGDLTAEIARAKKAEGDLQTDVNVRATKTELKNEIDAVKALIGDGETNLGDLESRVGAVETKSTANASEIARVDGKISTEISKVNAEVAKKANSADVNATTTRLEESIATKASTATMNTELAKKADKTQVATDIETAKNAAIAHTNTEVGKVQGSVNALTGRVSTNETDITNLKAAVAGKNSNNLVFNSFEEFNAHVTAQGYTAKPGDLAFVVNIKKAYIFKGVVDAVSLDLPTPPQGWVYFDEITSQVDLVDYLKKSEANSTYRKLSTKIAEADLATELTGKINAKADKTYVDGQVTTINGKISSKADESSVVSRLATKADKADTYTKAEVRAEVSKQMTVVSSVQPADKAEGHIWLEII